MGKLGVNRRGRFAMLACVLSLNLSNIVAYYSVLPVAREARAEAGTHSGVSLTCEQALQVALWGRDRFRESREVKIEASDFVESAVTGFLHKLDPLRILFLESEVAQFRRGGESAWPKWITEKRCDYFESWISLNYPRARAKLKSRLAALPVDGLYPKKLSKSSDLESVATAAPKFKTFAASEKEMADRLLEWARQIAMSSTPELLKAYRGDRRFFISDTVEQLLFDMRPQAPSLLAKAVLASMDPYSTYFSPTEFEEFYFDLAGGTSGIGIRVRKVPDGLFIEKIVEGSAAARSHRIRQGDIITSVDGIRLINLTATVSKHLLKGHESSRVRLELIRHPGGKPFLVKLQRRHFDFEDARISKKMFNSAKPGQGAVAVVSIPSFYGRGGMISDEEERSSAEDLRHALLEIVSTGKPLAALVLDLRDNPGGFLEEAVTMAGFFLPQSPVVEVVEPEGRRVLKPESLKPLYSGPLVVLVDHGTASASEVLAGALKDYQRAVIVGGKRTYGKGSVQKLFHLDDELLQTSPGVSLGKGVVKLTTSIFYSPLGHTPANGGIVPHISLPMESGKEEDVAAVPLRSVPEQRPFVDEARVQELKESEQRMKPRLTQLETLSRKRTIDVPRVLRQMKESEPDDEWELNEAVAIALDYSTLDTAVAKNAMPSRVTR